MKKTDRQLGMDRDISRRDFIHGAGLAAAGLSLPFETSAKPEAASQASESYYPPTRTGLRGSHPGSFEVAHALAREGKSFGPGESLDEDYDLVIVGGGISGLAAAYFERKLAADSRILILDNHEDFGGHATRNEFHQGGPMRLAWGGVFNLEYPMFSDTVHTLLEELGVDVDELVKRTDFNYGEDGRLGSATYFDAETYGKDVLIPNFSVRYGNATAILEALDSVPLSRASRDSMKSFYTARTDVLEGRSPEEREAYLRQISYLDFLKKHGGLTDEAAEIFVKSTHGYWGVGADSLSVAECRGAGLPMTHLLGDDALNAPGSVGGAVAMFPDGNASVARLLVRALIPAVAEGAGMDDIATASFDYSRLDQPHSPVRLRLSSTVVGVEESAGSVRVSFVRDGKTVNVRAKRCILACYHAVIPHLCPQLPEEQKEALRYQVKRPLLVTNVLLKSSKAADKLGIAGAYCPGRMHGATWLVKGIRSGEYRQPWNDAGPVVMQFWGSVVLPAQGLDIRWQHKSSRMLMLAKSFEDYEREVRTVLDGMLGPAGFSAAEDILAITVNRWPHGYSYDYMDLWDPKWPPGEAPHEIARRRFGRIAFANADAGANAYTHVAIDQAWRAVNELTS